MESVLVHRPKLGGLCHRCLRQSRSWSSTTSKQVAPESPRFVYVPIAPQVPRKPEPFKKGVLPVPRDLFVNGKGPRKATVEYLAAATPEPKPRDGYRPHGPDADRIMYNQRMAATRRSHLREGLVELKQRYNVGEKQRKVTAANKAAKRRRAVNAAEREDERLTSESVSQTIRDLLNDKFDTKIAQEEQEKLQISKKNVERIEAEKSAVRKDQLHTLYTHARNFIVSESQLTTELENVFGTDEDPIVWNMQDAADYDDPSMLSIWNLGLPETVDSLMEGKNRGNGLDKEQIELERLRKIAGIMTGGVIPPPNFKKIVLPQEQVQEASAQ